MAITDRQTATLALAHALSAAERGFPVFPLSATKLPALRSPHRKDALPTRCRGECGFPGHGVHDATTDPAAVRALFAAAPWATGYGIACGRPPHHLIGIDLDVFGAHGPDGGGGDRGTGGPRSNSGGGADHSSVDGAGADRALADSLSSLQDIALRHLFTIPETVTVLTPSGGRHLWLTGPADVVVPNSASRLAPGIDVRGAGGYLVGPGSVTPQGRYRLAPGSARLTPAPCPRALLHLVAPPARPHHPSPATARAAGPGRAQGQGLVHFVLAAHEGQRNTRLFWAACRAYENGFGDALADALVNAAVRAGLTEREARATIDSARRMTAT
ncbi:bifunctional DNA primase/polymerase [Streptomyces sp. NPDC047315]|uniref:bifunctional DNA primase/polymerase n=1 Tax=Streptomyces sp. NPDC047315 TaxID=3155142 RepID=UPI0033D48154